MDLLLVFDTSSNVKILDYRIMKEAVKLFIAENFDLRHVRVGLLRYGADAEVPLALGDYGSAGDLLARIGNARRLKGAANLETALREARAEFALSALDDQTPKVLIVWKSGTSKHGGGILQAAESLRYDMNVKVFVVSSGGEQHAEDLALVGDANPQRIISLPQWRGVDSEQLAAMADRICEVV